MKQAIKKQRSVSGSNSQVIDLGDHVGGSGTLDGFVPPLLQDGNYDLKFVNYRTGTFFGKAPKIVLYFEIMDFGENFGKLVAAYYNATRVSRRGFKVAFSGRFFREFCTLFPGTRRPDRLPMSRFESVIVVGRVETVVKTSKGPLPEGAQYSVVRELVGLKQ